ncbi:MAG: cytochrome c biogenesis CcdA family protein [Thermoplasmata archaeon]
MGGLLVAVEISFAVSAGVLTAFSPCGVPFLPNLVSFYLTDESGRLRGGPGSAAFALGLLTFLIPLAVFAALLSTVLAQYTAFFVLGGGITVIILALASYAGRPLVYFPGIRLRSRSSGYSGLFVMGITYTAASVGCTPALFFGVAATAVASASLASSTLILLAFTISVAVPTILLSLLASEYRETYQEKIRRLMGPLKKASTALMVGMGAYLILFYILYTLGWVTIA